MYDDFTESDVKAAARALTGWVVRRIDPTPRFMALRHDPTPQTLLGVGGVSDVDSTIDAILAHRATAPRVVDKIATALLGPDQDSSATGPLVGALGSDWELKPVVRGLLELGVSGAARPAIVEPFPRFVAAQRATQSRPQRGAPRTYAEHPPRDQRTSNRSATSRGRARLAGSGGGVMLSLNRRRFLGLTGGAAAASLVGALPLPPADASVARSPIATQPDFGLASARTLIVVEMEGGNDALNTLVPQAGASTICAPPSGWATMSCSPSVGWTMAFTRRSGRCGVSGKLRFRKRSRRSSSCREPSWRHGSDRPAPLIVTPPPVRTTMHPTMRRHWLPRPRRSSPQMSALRCCTSRSAVSTPTRGSAPSRTNCCARSQTASNLFAGLARSGHADRTLAITVSEFGRRAEENASRGTDHGNGGLSLVIGPAVAASTVLGGADLANLADGDLRSDIDTRGIYDNALRWLGASDDLVDDVIGHDWEPYDLLAL